MSRCFPYPPPGYTLSKANDEALIESIKLQEERLKSKKEHKGRDKAKDKEQRKKEKKEKKKEKKEQKKEEKKKEEKKKEKKDKSQQNLHKSDNVLDSVSKLCTNTKSELLQEGCKPKLEQLERSSLTEEHGHPVCSNAPSCSSDSTENSNKRKRQCSAEDVNRTHGKIIRIKLSKRPEESSISANEQQPCSTSERVAQQTPHNKDDIGLAHRGQGSCSTSKGPGKVGQAFDDVKAHPTSQQIKTVSPGKPETPPLKSTVMTPMQKLELHYHNLFENLALPSLQGASLPEDDLDWLFHSKSSNMCTGKKQISGIASMSCSGSQTWPHAQYLQDVDVYALPFTVPF